MDILSFHIKGKFGASVIQLYCSFYKVNPSEIVKQFQRHARYPNYEGYVAVEDEQVVGYIYGYSSRKGQYYHDLMSSHVTSAQPFLSDCMELAELGVHPNHRNKGIAKKLMETLLHRRKEKYAILTVRKENRTAISFYEKSGWIVLTDRFFPNVNDEYLIMGTRIGSSHHKAL